MSDHNILAKELMIEIEANLPLAVIPTKELQKLINERGMKVPNGHLFFIEKIFYMGDEGGICCGITLPDNLKEDLIVSITHLSINQSHLLGKKIKRYQVKRIKKLSKQRLS